MTWKFHALARPYRPALNRFFKTYWVTAACVVAWTLLTWPAHADSASAAPVQWWSLTADAEHPFRSPWGYLTPDASTRLDQELKHCIEVVHTYQVTAKISMTGYQILAFEQFDAVRISDGGKEDGTLLIPPGPGTEPDAKQAHGFADYIWTKCMNADGWRLPYYATSQKQSTP